MKRFNVKKKYLRLKTKFDVYKTLRCLNKNYYVDSNIFPTIFLHYYRFRKWPQTGYLVNKTKQRINNYNIEIVTMY